MACVSHLGLKPQHPQLEAVAVLPDTNNGHPSTTGAGRVHNPLVFYSCHPDHGDVYMLRQFVVSFCLQTDLHSSGYFLCPKGSLLTLFSLTIFDECGST